MPSAGNLLGTTRRRQPGPFGREPYQRTPEVQAAMQREHAAAQKRLNRAREAVHDLQSQALQPAR